MKQVGILILFTSIFLYACETELMRQQAEQIRLQQEEMARLKRENEELQGAKEKEAEKRAACNRAFRDFEKAQAAKNPRDAISLYRDGLRLCPDDDVAHYELGKILYRMGRAQEARGEFEAALKINPRFRGAQQELEKIKK